MKGFNLFASFLVGKGEPDRPEAEGVPVRPPRLGRSEF